MYTKSSIRRNFITEIRTDFKFNLNFFDRINYFRIISVLFAMFGIIFLISTILGLYLNTNIISVLEVLKSGGAISAIFVTFSSTLLTAAFCLLLGVPIAYYLCGKKTRLKKVIDILLMMPIVIPPAICGVALIASFGRMGVFGRYFPFSVSFRYYSIILVQLFVSLPIFIQILKIGFRNIEKQVIEAAFIDGAGEKDMMLLIFVPIAIKSIISGVIIALLRSAGEFGATMMFAGNIGGKTQTITTLIYTLTHKNLSSAIALAVVHISLFVLPLGIIRLFIEKE